jgi:hypothetical protein
MMLLVAMPALQGVKKLTFDATSPIYDANQGVFYVTKPSYLKLKSNKMAGRMASHDDAKWDCPCPFCQKFTSKYPFNYEQGRKLWKEHGLTEILPEDLKPGGLFYECYPLLSDFNAPALRRDIIAARVGHNHWMIEEAMKEINSAMKTKDRLATFAENIIKNYSNNTINEKSAKAYNLAYQIIKSDNINAALTFS